MSETPSSVLLLCGAFVCPDKCLFYFLLCSFLSFCRTSSLHLYFVHIQHETWCCVDKLLKKRKKKPVLLHYFQEIWDVMKLEAKLKTLLAVLFLPFKLYCYSTSDSNYHSGWQIHPPRCPF